MKWLMSISVCALSLLSACSTVSIDNQWKDPSFAGPAFSNVLVIGITRSDTMKRVFEDTFSQQLKTAGVQAAPGYLQIPQGTTSLDLGSLAKTTGVDAVLTTRVERVEQKISVTPSAPGYGYGGFYGWYGSAWASTPDVSQYELITLETSVWDVKSQKLVWTATTQGVRTNDLPKATRDLAAVLVPRLKAEGILR